MAGTSRRTTSAALAVPANPADVFVGRSEFIEILARPGGRAWILDTFGLLGSGKTKFLERIRKEVPARHPTVAFKIALGESDEPRGAEAGRDLAGAYARFRDLLAQLAQHFVEQEEERTKEAAARAMEPVTTALAAARQLVSPMKTDVHVLALFSKFENATIGETKGEFSDAWLETEIRTRQAELAQTFADTLAPALRGRHALVTIDGFEWVASAPLGDWLLDLVGRSQDTVAVIARTPAVDAPSAADVEVVTRALPPLTREEIATLLRACLLMPVDDRVVEVVATFSEGHAQTVGLAAELLQRLEPAACDADAVRRRLQSLPDDLAKQHGDLVDAILEHDGAEVAEVVRTCSILRRFDAALLEAVAGLEVGKGADAVAALQRYSFVDPVDDPRGGFFALHDFIRSELERRLEANDPQGARKRQRAAAEHIATWLTEYEEGAFPDGRKAYGGWYRYERPEWRAAAQEWLYHEARAAGGPGAKRERERARLRFARMFFDAFWWWGCYREFPAIRELLADWRETQADVGWTAHLVGFVNAYPIGYVKDDDPARWEQVERSLRLVRAAIGLAGDPAADDDEQAHVRGLMANFSAHAARYARTADDEGRRQSYDEASAHYDEAVRLFTAEGDDWDLAWTLFERAELHLEHGGAAAHDDWAAAVELLPELGDDELTANLYRLAADARWQHAPQEAFALHSRAILHAYLFQGRYQGMRYRPDAYTLDFYAEQIERAIDRLIELTSVGGDVAAAVADLRDPLLLDAPVHIPWIATCCTESDRAELALLFPEPPAQGDLERDESAFLERWEENVAELDEPDAAVDPAVW